MGCTIPHGHHVIVVRTNIKWLRLSRSRRLRGTNSTSSTRSKGRRRQAAGRRGARACWWFSRHVSQQGVEFLSQSFDFSIGPFLPHMSRNTRRVSVSVNDKRWVKEEEEEEGSLVFLRLSPHDRLSTASRSVPGSGPGSERGARSCEAAYDKTCDPELYV